MQRTYMVKKEELEDEREWYLIDARGQRLGRLAARIATILQGKHKPIYTPHAGVGDYIIVINAEKIRVTGKKLDQKVYYRYSGYPGGLRTRPLREVLERNPTLPLKQAILRMLPKNAQGRRAFRRLKVYPGPDHPHQAQNPIPLKV